MRFKNVLVYLLTQPLDLHQLADKLNEREFKPCAGTDSMSVGWAKPAEFLQENNLVYRISQYDLIALKTESKVLPSASINKILIKKITEIESREQRRVKGRERADLKDQIIHELLPRALSKESVTMAYVDRVKHQIVVNASISTDEDGVIKLKNIDLLSQNVRSHIDAGGRVTKNRSDVGRQSSVRPRCEPWNQENPAARSIQ